MKKNHIYIKKHITLIGHSPDEVELRHGVWNPISHFVHDEEKSGKLFATLCLMDGSLSTTEIAEKVGLKRSKIEGLVDYLSRLLVVELAPASSIDYYVNHAITGLMPLSEKLKKVNIVASTTMGKPLQSLLQKTNYFEAIDLLKDLDLLEKAKKNKPWEKDSLAFETLLNQLQDWKDRLIVVVSSQIDPLLMQAINHICLSLQTPFLMACIDGPFIFIGPTIIPGKTACWQCFEKRVTMNLKGAAAYLNYKNALLQGKVKAAEFHAGELIQNMLLSHAAMEILNLGLTSASFTTNKVLSIYLPTMEIVYHDVLRLSACEACSPTKYAEEKELYFSTKSLIQ